MMKMILTVLFASIYSATIFAQDNQSLFISQHKQWYVYKSLQGKEGIYFTFANPSKSEGKYSVRGNVSIMITHSPQRKKYNEVSFHAGYAFKPNSTVTVKIDNQTFTAFASGETCWFPDDMDTKVVSALTKGKTLTIEGQSARGTKTVDTFSLAGSTAAIKDLDKAAKKL